VGTKGASVDEADVVEERGPLVLVTVADRLGK